jgi:hypothetical protein
VSFKIKTGDVDSIEPNYAAARREQAIGRLSEKMAAARAVREKKSE